MKVTQVFKKRESSSHGGKSDLTLKTKQNKMKQKKTKKPNHKIKLRKLIQKCDYYQFISLSL